MYICNICNKEFSTKGNLNVHKEKAKYCKKMQFINCEYCSKQINVIDYIENHKYICLEFNYNKNKKDFFETINRNKELEKQNNELKQQNKELHDQLKDFTLKLIEKPNNITNNTNYMDTKVSNSTNTTNNTKIDMFNSLLPLTEDDFKNNINNLTIEHVRRGAEGYIEYSLNFPFKNKLMCLDYGRKKLCYKDENGNKIEDPKLNKLAVKLFNYIDSRNTELITQLFNEIREKSLELDKNTTEYNEGSREEKEYSDMSDYYLELGIRYGDMLCNSKKIIKGESNPLFMDIVNGIIDKIHN